MNVVHDREQPCAQVGARPPQPSLFPCARERVLHEVVGAGRVAGQHARVAAQPRESRRPAPGAAARVRHGEVRSTMPLDRSRLSQSRPRLRPQQSAAPPAEDPSRGRMARYYSARARKAVVHPGRLVKSIGFFLGTRVGLTGANRGPDSVIPAGPAARDRSHPCRRHCGLPEPDPRRRNGLGAVTAGTASRGRGR